MNLGLSGAHRQRIAHILALALIATVLSSMGLLRSGSTVAAAVTTDPIVGDWNVTYGAPALVTMTLSGGLYTGTAKTPVQVTGSSCDLPAGTVIATFSSTGGNSYSGQHGLWYTSDCSFGYWDGLTLTLSTDGNTLTGVLAGGYGTVIFTKAISPTITSVSAVSPQATQTILISGSGFGTQAPFNGDLPCIEASDLTAGWNAGHADPASAPGSDTGASCGTAQSSAVDVVTIGVSSWTDTAITITGFTGLYGSPYVLTPGDQIIFRIWNAQTGAGPVTFTTTVAALTGRPPSPARAVKVDLANGAATVTWKASSRSGSFPIDYYAVTATPVANDRLPKPQASPVTATVPSNITSWTLRGLVADCHQTYKFSVTAHNAAGTSRPAGQGPLYRPSGIVQQNSDPPLVVLLIDGKSFSGPTPVTGSGASYNPLKPTTSGPFSYCPELPWDGVSAQTPTNFAPALQDFLGEGNGKGWNWALPPIDFTNPTTTYTHSYMLDPLAATGAVVVPYGYPSGPANFVRLKNGRPNFTFPGYSTSGDSDPYAEAAQLATEVKQINTVWPTSRIVIIGHSHGGLIAYLYWGGVGFGPGARAAGVTHIISLDSPINGVEDLTLCGNCTGSPTGDLYATLWRASANLDQLAIQNDSDQSFTPIGTVGDKTFDGFDVTVDGIFSQLLFNCSSGGFLTSDNCTAAFPPDVSSQNCAITAQTNPIVAGTSHFAVRICPDYVATIARDAGVNVP